MWSESSATWPASDNVPAGLEVVVLRQLAALVGESNVIGPGDERLAVFGTDWPGRLHRPALLVVCPGNTQEVAGVVRVLADAGLPIVPQGGNTGLCGGAIPSRPDMEVVVSLSRMRRILDVDTVANTMRVEAGCILQQVQQAAADAGRTFPLSLAAEGSCQIGGNVATNAGGVSVLRYGSMRSLVLGLEVVLADGCVLDLLSPLRKDNTGFDLKQLFIGSEGALGIVTQVNLALHPRASQSMTLMAAVDSPQNAMAAFEAISGAFGPRVVAFELLDGASIDAVVHHMPGTRAPFEQPSPFAVLVQLEDTLATAALAAPVESLVMQLLEDGICTDACIAQSVAQARSLWALRENITESLRNTGRVRKFDVSLPLRRIPAFIAELASSLEREPSLRLHVFGHVGDGNLHVNVVAPAVDAGAASDFPDDMVYGLVAGHGGSFSAEHGIGQLKVDSMRRYKSQDQLRVMRLLKQSLDPRGLLNPGKVLPA